MILVIWANSIYVCVVCSPRNAREIHNICVCVCYIYIYIECSPRNAREIHHILGMAGRRNVFAHISRNPLWSWVFKPSQENLRFWFCNILCVCMIMYAYILFSHLVLQLAMCRWRQRAVGGNVHRRKESRDEAWEPSTTLYVSACWRVWIWDVE